MDVAEGPAVAHGYRLDQNYPNPFNPSTAITYQLAGVGQASLRVFDLLGREVAMLGPAPAALERLRGLHRWHILFRADGPRSLFKVHAALAAAAARPPGGASVRFDMDPYSMM